MNSNGASGDDRLWKLDVDKSGNGYAVIRFLPAPENEDLPFVKLYSHAFQGARWMVYRKQFDHIRSERSSIRV